MEVSINDQILYWNGDHNEAWNEIENEINQLDATFLVDHEEYIGWIIFYYIWGCLPHSEKQTTTLNKVRF